MHKNKSDRDICAQGRLCAEALHPGRNSNARICTRALKRDFNTVRCLNRQWSKTGSPDSRSAEWLRDNLYIIQRACLTAAERLHSARHLRTLEEDRRTAFVCSAAERFVSDTGGSADADDLVSYFSAFCLVTLLTEEEIAVLDAAVISALVSRIAHLCTQARAGEAVSAGIGDAVTSLRSLLSIEISSVCESLSAVEEIYMSESSGIYGAMDESSHSAYRRRTAELARKAGIPEADYARGILEKAETEHRHIGEYLFSEETEERNRSAAWYAVVITALSVLAAASAASLSGAWYVGVLLFIPATDAVKKVFDALLVRLCRRRPVHSMALPDGIPDEARTLVVVSVLLSDAAETGELASALENYRITNRDSGKNLLFSVLADMPESTDGSPSGEKSVSALRKEVDRLNEKYSGGFFVFTRGLTYYQTEKKYMPWERKRGGIEQLCGFLRGSDNGITCAAGDPAALGDIKYIIVLDSDTVLSAGSAKKLVAAACHPLNWPVIDDEARRVVRGHGIIQPRISTELKSSERTLFSKITSGGGGYDIYCGSYPELYQDVFMSGSFCGKGLIDIDAYNLCITGRFTDNRVLSHDLLEGAYLRCAFHGEVELCDSTPSNVFSWYKRLARWIRGDWQNLQFLGKRYRCASGEYIENSLRPVERIKLIDNLRRSLVPVALFASLIAAPFSIRSCAAVISALAAAYADTVIALISELFSGELFRFRRYFHGIAGGVLSSATSCTLRLLFLPYEATISLTAAVKALYRTFISGRHMLEWQTASAAEKLPSAGIGSAYLKMWISPLSGILLTAAGSPVLKVVGLIWVLSPMIAWITSKERRAQDRLSYSDIVLIRKYAADMWRYFDSFITEKDHMLPPDNWQERPHNGLAHRTSPTNIGLALVSAAAALDLKLADKGRVLDIISGMLGTVAGLEKRYGQLYNWYDTRTLRPLEPRFVSSVDSGNLAVCLTALLPVLTDLGAGDLAETVGGLLSDMDFGPLYDDKRMLLYTGIFDDGTPSESTYDLFESEAMMTSYYCVAKGAVPARHWRRLSRGLSCLNGYYGMISWSGTMFEYFMPALFLPMRKGSAAYESLCFALYAQRRDHAPGGVWGRSESVYYAFDGKLNYSYKANGSRRLAYSSDIGADCVISPYSSFLAMAVDPAEALNNLKMLEKFGAYGMFGFYDAVDFTASRCADSTPRVVKNHMVHHLGMSLIAVDNLLNGNVMRKRLFSDVELSSFSELLAERPHTGRKTYTPPKIKPERPLSQYAAWSVDLSEPGSLSPVCAVMSNGRYTVAQEDNGSAMSMYDDNLVFRWRPGADDTDCGLLFFIRSGEEVYPLQAAPMYFDDQSLACRLSASECVFSFYNELFASKITRRVPDDEYGELISVSVAAKADIEAELVVYAEPALASYADYYSHPAFSKLSIQSSFNDGILTFSRRSGGRQDAVSLSFACDREYTFDTSRERSLSRGGIMSLKSYLKEPAGGTLGSVLDPCLLVRIPLSMRSGGTVSVTMTLAVSSVGGSCDAAKRLLSDAAFRTFSGIFTHVPPETVGQSMYLLSRLMSDERPEYDGTDYEGKRSLWKFGISGDFPIAISALRNADDVGRSRMLIDAHRLLSLAGLGFDAVIINSSEHGYDDPLRSEITAYLSSLGLLHTVGARGGVHILDDRDVSAVMAASRATAGEELRRDACRPLPLSFTRHVSRLFPDCSFDSDGSMTFNSTGGILPCAWSHILTNGRIGCTVTDAGFGSMWFENAHEYGINGWENDPLSITGAESAFVEIGGVTASLFCGDDGRDCRVTFGFGFARWIKVIQGVTFTAEISVDADLDVRRVVITSEPQTEFFVLYHNRLELGPARADAPYTVTSFTDGIFTARNPSAQGFESTVFTLGISAEAHEFTCSENAWRCGDLDGFTGCGTMPCFALRIRAEAGRCAIVCGTAGSDDIARESSYERSTASLKRTYHYWRATCGSVRIETPDKLLDSYMNGWALYQTYACRVLARSSLYQRGGAYGYRDQLQDVCGIADVLPEVAREHIIRAAGHQYLEGDVQHWWHEYETAPSAGVRTRYSDDLLWLPYALCRYLDVTGDITILSETAPFLSSPLLKDGETDRYETVPAGDIDTVFEHAVRSVELVMRRGTGDHGLCLIGGGDWNDGMNLVGAKGRGESVWLTWFASIVAGRMSDLCLTHGDKEHAEAFSSYSDMLRSAAESAWDGKWYRRGYYDSGEVLGGAVCSECRIDSIAQSYAAMAGADDDRVRTALSSAVDLLFDRDGGIVMLFSPPFDRGGVTPGYISGYSPGFRENGGQYTHGAVWLAGALLESGDTETGYEILRALLPSSHDTVRYRTEPYVLAADVYSNADHYGRGGWTWYTGAAGWYRRIVLENLLGIRVRDGTLSVSPNLPAGWSGYSASVRLDGRMITIRVRRSGGYEIDTDSQDAKLTIN